jgi:hypothetical protein
MATFTTKSVVGEGSQIIVTGEFTDATAGTWTATIFFSKEEITTCTTTAVFRDTIALPRLRESYNAYMDSFNKMKIATDYMQARIGQAITL